MDLDSSVFQQTGHSLNGIVTSQPLQTSAVLCNVLPLCILFSLSWQTSLLPIFSFCVDMSLLMLVSSLSPHCSSFGPTHAIFHSIAMFINCTEVTDPDAHIHICTAFSLCLTVQIPTCSAFRYYRLSAQSQYLYTQKPHVVSLYLPKSLHTSTNSVPWGTECKKWQHGKLCLEEVL